MIDIISEPEFKNKDFVMEIRPEYRRAYNIYKKSNDGEVFLGVAFYNTKYKKLVADKVFARGDSK